MNNKLFLLIVSAFIIISLNPHYVFGDPGDTITTVDASANDVGKYTFIAIGHDGNPVISYFDSTTEEFKLIHCTNSTCTTKDIPITLDSVGDVRNPASIAIGTDTYPIIAYQDKTNGLKILHCTSIDCTSRDSPVILDDVGVNPSIATGVDGFPIIGYNDQFGFTVAHCKDISCNTSPDITEVGKIDFGEIFARFISLKIGSDNNPIISYQTPIGENLVITHCTNVSCTTFDEIQILDSEDRTGWYTSLEIGSDNNPIISYHLLSGDSEFVDLRVVHCNNVSCSDFNAPVTVDDGHSAGKYSSIAIGSDNLPIISHNGFLSLKISHCKNVDCSLFDPPTIVEHDLSSAVGWHTSIAKGSDNLPVVSYYDFGNDDLKVVHCSTVDCSTFNPTPCMVPSSGPWVISQSCIYYSFGENVENITVTDNSLLTVDGTWLGFDFKSYGITVESGSGILIKNDGRIALLD